MLNRLPRLVPLATTLLSYSLSCSSPSSPQLPYLESCQYSANTPIEDRITCTPVDAINGAVVGVFDGHGGDLCADYAAANLGRFVAQRLGKLTHKQREDKAKVSVSVEQAFDDMEYGFKALFERHMDEPAYRSVGACALVALLTPKMIYIGNAGDCEGAILGGQAPISTNERLNAGEPQEKNRLMREFPNEPDIVRCIPGTNYCYVKNRLQPTRSLGDFYLKNPEYNFTKIKVFTGPYITHKPKITTFQLNQALGNTLVLGSDGLWDELDLNQVDRALRGHHGKPGTARLLLDKCFTKILTRNRISSVDALTAIPNRRNLHDDISIVTVDLKGFLDRCAGKKPEQL